MASPIWPGAELSGGIEHVRLTTDMENNKLMAKKYTSGNDADEDVGAIGQAQLPPVINATGTSATFSSCFRVSTSNHTGPYVVGVDHGYEKMQNSVLLVLDNITGFIGQETDTLLNQYYT